MNRARLLMVLMVLVLVITACGGDDDDTPASTPVPSNPDANIDFSLLGDAINSSQVPRGLTTNGQLAVINKSEFVHEGVLNIAYVVQNNSDEVYEAVVGVVTLVDPDDFVLDVINISASATHIPPGGLVVLQKSYPVTDYPNFDGLAVNIIPSAIETSLNVTAYVSQAPATIDANTGQLQGDITNGYGVTLQTLVAHFLLYDAEDNLLNVVPATLTEPFSPEGWSPDTTIAYMSQRPPLPQANEVAVARTDLLVYGYVYQTQ